MNTQQLLEYLHVHPATHKLAEALAAILVVRGVPDLVPVTVPTRERVAS